MPTPATASHTAPSAEPAPAKATLRKREILQAASAVFRRQGLQGTGMRDIAAELGMHVGNLYYYFRNKQELLAFCQQDALGGLLALAERVRALALRPDAALWLLVVGHVVQLNEETPGSLAHLEVEALEPEWRRAILEQRDTYDSALRDLIERGIAAGIFRPTDSKVAALALLGALNWTVKWYRPRGTKSARQIGEEFAGLLVRGLMAPGVEMRVPETPLPLAGADPEPVAD
jgi:AcrR family transcriptional regulator